ncbi:MAG TPA: hypothetical protein PKK31_11625, partial [Elusimicrobiales bacterium]|nr:hypothetical protein [Elusimicrobiales bacterium]
LLLPVLDGPAAETAWASAVAGILDDEELRKALAAAGPGRAADFAPDRTRAAWLAALALPGAGTR